mmetsp:Transcript_98167/g.194412  ORF Transcript_98167/g.194412 Transcript_98167/m.194412 type:complete len:205 (+) Transcript_98167:1105-1719(+)
MNELSRLYQHFHRKTKKWPCASQSRRKLATLQLFAGPWSSLFARTRTLPGCELASSRKARGRRHRQEAQESMSRRLMPHPMTQRPMTQIKWMARPLVNRAITSRQTRVSCSILMHCQIHMKWRASPSMTGASQHFGSSRRHSSFQSCSLWIRRHAATQAPWSFPVSGQQKDARGQSVAGHHQGQYHDLCHRSAVLVARLPQLPA